MTQKTKKEIISDIIAIIITIIVMVLIVVAFFLIGYQLKERCMEDCAKQNNTGMIYYEEFGINCSQFEEIKNNEVAG